MPETQPELSLPPKLSEAERAKISQRGRALWPDPASPHGAGIKPQHEKDQIDLSQITRDIARGS